VGLDVQHQFGAAQLHDQLVRYAACGVDRNAVARHRFDVRRRQLVVRIIVPLITPALGAFAIFAFMAEWNDYIWQLIVLQKETMKTLPLGVSGLIRQDLSIN
jgi:hypothetical protein